MRTFAFIAPLVLLSTACTRAPGTDDTAESVPAATPSSSPEDAGMTAALKGEGGIAGQARVTPSADGFELALTLTGAPAGPHGWHIHQAPCGVSGAPIVVALSEKPGQTAVAGELDVAADGTVNRRVQVPGSILTVEQLQAGDYSLHVHKTGGAQHGPSIACAGF